MSGNLIIVNFIFFKTISYLQSAPDTDDPPFNFQGMLRKTKYNRNSMKRNTEGGFSLPPNDVNNNSGKFKHMFASKRF